MRNFSQNMLSDIVVDAVNMGILVLNKELEVVFWNRFMASSSGVEQEEVIGKNIFLKFPELSEKWLSKKIDNVFVINNYSFTSWEQRPYLFKFEHHSPVTCNFDAMRQNCTFIPVRGQQGEVEFVCITVLDVTDIAISQNKLEKLTEQLTELNNRDALTHLYNRGYLDKQLSNEFNRVKRYGGQLSVVHLDIDHFKRVNDKYGHLGGDQVLRKVAKILNHKLRETDFISRYGGEEFTAVLPETDLHGAYLFAERLRAAVENAEITLGQETVKITVSVGVSNYHEGLDCFEDLLNESDIALYRSKDEGRNRVTSYIPSAFTGEHKNADEVALVAASQVL